MDCSKIINKYQTPCFVYDINELHNRIDYLKKYLNRGKLVYAIKANTFIVKELFDSVERLEICSDGEFDICNRLNLDKSKFVISGVYKNPLFIERLIKDYDDIGRYTIESLNHYELLDKYTKKYKRCINVLIRLTSENQFGVSESDFRKILDLNKDNKYINVSGIEYFSGTQKHNIKRIEKEINYINEFVSQIENDFNLIFDEVEFGPGLPIFYFQDDEFNEEEFLDQINDLLKVFNNKKIYLEVGRSIAASCGYYFTRVVDLKMNKYSKNAILDGGINHLVYYGQTMAMRVPFYDIIQGNIDKLEESYTLYGSLCTINDIIVKGITCKKLSIGDVFVFKNVGAYSSTEGISLFLSHDLPRVIILKEDGNTLLVRDFIKTSDINFPNY